ncbi:hypothetical protein [Streptomyces albus]|uniref:hypothetical protein n=1 Tax=Streptomyces sp. NRRL F-5639 TaxID=1463867 RepID=UPI00131A94F9|nr:hypothetical protein [Streptomyces sp. NRRL F-5639]
MSNKEDSDMEIVSRKVKATPRHDWEQAIRACPDIPPAKMSTLWAVAMHIEFGTGKHNKDKSTGKPRFVPDQALLAATAKKTIRAVSGDLEWAREEGWLFRYATNRGVGKPDIYWLTIPDHEDHEHDWDTLWERSVAIRAKAR